MVSAVAFEFPFVWAWVRAADDMEGRKGRAYDVACGGNSACARLVKAARFLAAASRTGSKIGRGVGGS